MAGFRASLGGSVVKSLPARAGDTGSIPDPGGAHRLWSNYARVLQLLSPCSRALGPQLLKPGCPTAHAPQREATAVSIPRPTTREKACAAHPKVNYSLNG